MAGYALTGLKFTIASGAATSDILPIAGSIIGSLQLPAAITGSTLTFNYSNREDASASDMVAAQNKTNTGAEAAITVAANQLVHVPTHIMEARYLSITLGSNQAAERSVVLHLESPA